MLQNTVSGKRKAYAIIMRTLMALATLMTGALVLFLAVWVLRRLGMSFETGPAAQTILFQFFTTHTPLDVLSLLQ